MAAMMAGKPLDQPYYWHVERARVGNTRKVPVELVVNGKAVRASRKSAQWCLDAVDACWDAKRGNIRREERGDAEQAYEVAREAYRKVLAESTRD